MGLLLENVKDIFGLMAGILAMGINRLFRGGRRIQKPAPDGCRSLRKARSRCSLGQAPESGWVMVSVG